MRKRKSKARRTIFIIFALIVLITASVFGYFFSQLGKINHVSISTNDTDLGIGGTASPGESPVPTDMYSDKIFNILLFGSDRRTSSDRGNSDSMMVLTLNGKDKTIKLVSIMRDMYVNIPGYGMNKINAAYPRGGATLLLKTINSNFGLDLRNYMEIDFDGLIKVVDTLGGVTVTIKSYEIPAMKPYGITKAGTYTLNGVKALAYSRIRHYGDSDFERTQRQRTVLIQLFQKLGAQGVTKFPALMNSLLPYIETTLSTTDILSMSIRATSYGLDKIEQQRIPYDGHCYDMSGKVYYLGWEKTYTLSHLHDFIYGTKTSATASPTPKASASPSTSK